MREQDQADALAEVERRAGEHHQAHRRERSAMADLNVAVLNALDAGCTTRRVRELSGLSLNTIHKWRHQTNQDYAHEFNSRAGAHSEQTTEWDEDEHEADPSHP